MKRVASFHLAQRPTGLRSLGPALGSRAVPHRLAGRPGLVLGRVLATAPDSSPSGPDPSRWALFTVWEDESALEEWLASEPLLDGWADEGAEVFAVRLEPLTAHGRWDGIEPFPGLAGVHGDDQGGPLAVLTWAQVRARRRRRFSAASEVVDEALRLAPGRLAAVGMEAGPAGRRGTFSLWQSRAALTEFAYGSRQHADVVRRTRIEAWYGEELFARFRPYRHEGTWAGLDPLRPAD
jgi:hypothetical protein